METLASVLLSIVVAGLLVFALGFILSAAAILYIVWRALNRYF